MTDILTDIEQTDKEKDKEVNRRDFIVLTATALAGVGGAIFAWPVIDSLNPSAEVLSLGSVEVDLAPIKEGQSITILWRGKPVFIRHRTKKEIDEAITVNLSDLKDPQSDDQRVKKGHEKWLVMIGICTHLGCVPIGGKGDYNGWFCPCHGSQYDSSGRVRSGPAPQNLHIPEYSFMSDSKIKIG
jgi:ubiquinol-cytochrome c reductase iron-sulfur subunit